MSAAEFTYDTREKGSLLSFIGGFPGTQGVKFFAGIHDGRISADSIGNVLIENMAQKGDNPILHILVIIRIKENRCCNHVLIPLGILVDLGDIADEILQGGVVGYTEKCFRIDDALDFRVTPIDWDGAGGKGDQQFFGHVSRVRGILTGNGKAVIALEFKPFFKTVLSGDAGNINVVLDFSAAIDWFVLIQSLQQTHAHVAAQSVGIDKTAKTGAVFLRRIACFAMIEFRPAGKIGPFRIAEIAVAKSQPVKSHGIVAKVKIRCDIFTQPADFNAAIVFGIQMF